MTSPSQKPLKLNKHMTPERLADQVFYWLTLLFAVGSAAVLVLIAIELWTVAYPAIREFGWQFVTTTRWDPVQNVYGVLPQIYGTLITAVLSLVLAIPVGLGVAIFLSEDFLPPFILTPIAFFIELWAAIPSVALGLWGIYVMIPAILPFGNWLHETLGWIPLFGTTFRGPGIFPTVLILALMIVPIITAISRDTLISLPPELRQGSMALGATRWETILWVLIPSGLSGIVGSIMLALGRAMGETMVAAMLIGNANRLPLSIFEPASTIASLIANQFGEAGGLQVASLLYAALILMLMTLLVNVAAELIIRRFQEVE